MPNPTPSTPSLTYRASGVDAEGAAQGLKGLLGSLRRTIALRPAGEGRVLLDFGHYANVIQVGGTGLAISTDGVGSKILIAEMAGVFDTLGIDLVAMNVNDLLTSGARPISFLDYLAVGRLSSVPAEAIIRGIAEGCRLAGASLVGGETAEMPGFYRDGEYDLAGFAIGVAERRRLIDGSRVRPGDALVGLRSTGLHSNGYSLARRALRATTRATLMRKDADLGETLGEALLRPTAIYVKPVLAALERFRVRGMAHITGGGIPGNLVRILPRGCNAIVERPALPTDPLFELIRRRGKIERGEMDRTFNCGIGYVMIVAARDADALVPFLGKRAVAASVIGMVRRGARGVRYSAGDRSHAG